MIGEEFGFAGNIFILLIYLLLTISILRISFRVNSRFAPAYLYRHWHDGVFLYVRKCGDGDWIAAGCWRAIAADFLWRHLNANGFSLALVSLPVPLCMIGGKARQILGYRH